MKYYLVSATLVGLCFDIAGAFFLSAQAIGLDRIRNWRTEYLDISARIAGARKTVEAERLAQHSKVSFLPSALGVIAGFIGSYVGASLALYIKSLNLKLLPSYADLILGMLIGGAIGFYAFDVFSFAFRKASSALIWIDNSTQKGAIGLIGFGLLLVGFILQFIGALSSFQ